jgi:hypothetical protein
MRVTGVGRILTFDGCGLSACCFPTRETAEREQFGYRTSALHRYQSTYDEGFFMTHSWTVHVAALQYHQRMV